MINSVEITAKFRPLSLTNLEDLGDILQYLLPWSALLAVALQGNRESAWIWLYVGTTNTILTHFLKFIFNFTFLGKRPNAAGYAFPSGHTSSAFMGAAFFHFNFGLIWAILPYILAGITGYSRVMSKKHWWRDVVAGAILAIIVNYLYFFIILN